MTEPTPEDLAERARRIGADGGSATRHRNLDPDLEAIEVKLSGHSGCGHCRVAGYSMSNSYLKCLSYLPFSARGSGALQYRPIPLCSVVLSYPEATASAVDPL